jgi:DNA polymerase-4
MIEPASIDEGYLDMTDYCADKDALEVAQKIQNDLLEQHQLPCSIGIAPNMFLAKMASDMKKPLGITILRKRDVQEKLWPLPIEAMHGIGRKTFPNLKLLGIETIGDLAQFTDQRKLAHFLGNAQESFQAKAWGQDDRLIDPTRANTYQSIGHSKTFSGYLHEYSECIEALADLNAQMVERLIAHELNAKTLTVQMRNHRFEQRSKSFTFPFHTQDETFLMQEVERLFDELYDDQPVHLLGVSASHLEKEERLFKQLDIFMPAEASAKDTVEDLLKEINKHYAKPILKKGLK